MSRVILAPKTTGEVRTLLVDLSSVLNSGTTASACTTTATVYSGTDSNPSAIISGAATIVSGTTVKQKITGGVAGVTYILTFTITVTDGTAVVQGYLTVLP